MLEWVNFVHWLWSVQCMSVHVMFVNLPYFSFEFVEHSCCLFHTVFGSDTFSAKLTKYHVNNFKVNPALDIQLTSMHRIQHDEETLRNICLFYCFHRYIQSHCIGVKLFYKCDHFPSYTRHYENHFKIERQKDRKLSRFWIRLAYIFFLFRCHFKTERTIEFYAHFIAKTDFPYYCNRVYWTWMRFYFDRNITAIITVK